MDSIHNVYLAWLSRVEIHLNLQYELCVADIGYAEWAFDWHAAWVAGCSPHEAIQDALRELEDRGMLDVVREVARTMRQEGCPPETARDAAPLPNPVPSPMFLRIGTCLINPALITDIWDKDDSDEIIVYFTNYRDEDHGCQRLYDADAQALRIWLRRHSVDLFAT